MSWFVAIVQDADASHANPYACAGSDNAKSSLRLCGLPTLHTQIITLVQALDNLKKPPTAVQAPDNSHGIPYVLQVPDNLTVFLRRCRHPIVDMRMLMLVQVPNNSSNSLRLCRFKKCYKFLMPVQASNNSHANHYACEGS
ncbi:hypothetical protein O181_070566 [Austropuccinia psidii MF-1]|uniref:Uncharacterized protein n=1 Tax=Austropuccinia psidii MF-1 TaxID=1389203 RepID=A0A9Q3EZ10_9BASI|nr:hypothetical protein [Austropuccinia psidii MF-1]